MDRPLLGRQLHRFPEHRRPGGDYVFRVQLARLIASASSIRLRRCDTSSQGAVGGSSSAHRLQGGGVIPSNSSPAGGLSSKCALCGCDGGRGCDQRMVIGISDSHRTACVQVKSRSDASLQPSLPANSSLVITPGRDRTHRLGRGMSRSVPVHAGSNVPRVPACPAACDPSGCSSRSIAHGMNGQLAHHARRIGLPCSMTRTTRLKRPQAEAGPP